jgi:hypothetical protein
MNVASQIKVPVEVALALKEKLKILQAAHDAELAKVDHKLNHGGGDMALLAKTRDDLVQRGRTLTLNNLLRMLVIDGADKVRGMKDVEILKHLTQSGLVQGRPRVRDAA